MPHFDTDLSLALIAAMVSDLPELRQAGNTGAVRQCFEAVLDLAEVIRNDLRSDAPALHMVFDDTDDMAALVVTPSLNMRVGDEVHRLALICKEDLEVDVVRRALGPEVTKSVLSLFSISELLREIGVESLTALSEDLEGQVGKYVQEAVEEPIAL